VSAQAERRAREVLIVPTGVANLASVKAGLRRAGGSPRLERDAAAVLAADLVVLPGVGAFGAGMAELRATGIDRALRERLADDRPTMAVCLGMHLLCDSSDETPGVQGLGVVKDHVEHFPDTVRAPQFGWNRITPEPGCRWLREGYAYFANSYCLRQCPPGWKAARAEHGGTFIAAMERGSALVCQFHPELSGPFGVDLMTRWIAEAGC
jgi:imidazole glycerol phosphate synthase glutamine amidotransferase subunit